MKRICCRNDKGNVPAIIIAIILIIILIGGCFLVIVQEGILSVVSDVVNDIMDFINNPQSAIAEIWRGASNSVSFMFNFGSYTPPESTGFIIMLEDNQIETIKQRIEDGAIETQRAGLTDVMLKKMILVNYMTTSTIDTEIGLPLDESQLQEIVEELDKKGITFSPVIVRNGQVVSGSQTQYNDGVFSYWTGDGEERGEYGKWYISVHGIVKLEDENGQRIYPYNNTGSPSDFDKIAIDCRQAYEQNRIAYANSIKNAMQWAYTINNLGSVQMNKVSTSKETKKYLFEGQEISSNEYVTNVRTESETLEYSQYISQYAMTMDFLVSLLEITGSDDFVEAVCDLVGQSEIVVVISANQISNVDVNTEKYVEKPTVKGIQEKKTKTTTTTNNNGTRRTSTRETSEYQDVEVVNQTGYNIEKETIKESSSMQYNLCVKKVETWYCSAEYDLGYKLKVRYTNVDQDGNEVTDEEEYTREEVGNDTWYNGIKYDDYKDEINANRIWISKDDKSTETTYANRYENALDFNAVNALFDSAVNDDLKLRARILSKTCSDMNFFRDENLANEEESQNNQENSSSSNRNTSTSVETTYEQPRVTKIIENMTNRKSSEAHVSMEKVSNNASVTTDYEDNTDKFLGLLRNQTGTYVKGAPFKSDGIKVKYDDIYGGQSVVGDLLVNGSDMLFQFMESTTSYNKGLESVMKYILYRYSNEDFGVTDFNSAMDWMRQSSFSSVGSGGAEECLHQMMASYEGTITTSDGSKYLVLDGYNNDGFHSISTAYGFLFYANSYNGYARDHEAAMNQAYIDCGQTNMTLDRAIGGLIDANGNIKTNLVSNNAFPESYALPKDVVDRAHVVEITQFANDIREEVASYNQRNGRNITLNDGQVLAMVDCRWQYGYSFSYSDFIAEYGRLGDNPTETQIDSLLDRFLPFNDPVFMGSGRPQARRKLFKEGVFTLSDGSVIVPSQSSGGSMGVVNAAKSLVELTKLGGREQVSYSSSRRSSNGYSSGIYVCASFVSEVLFNASGFRNWSDNVQDLGIGLSRDSNFELIYYNAQANAHPSVSDFSSSKNLNMDIESDIRPGDVVAIFSNDFTFQHVVVYIGEGKYAHHGGGSGEWNYPNISSNFFANYTKNNIKYIFRYKGQ